MTSSPSEAGVSVYRHPRRWVGGAIVISFIVIATALLVVPLGDDPGVGFAVVSLALVAVAVTVRIARARVEASSTGVRIVNPFRTYSRRWDDIADFDITSERELMR